MIKFSNFFTRGNTIEYQYNCQNKLIKGIYPNDAVGNILNKETKILQNDDEYLGLQLYAYNNNNQISSAFDGTYLYDKNGNLIEDCYNTAYTYDCYKVRCILNMRENFKMIILIGVIILFSIFCVYAGMLIHWINHTKTEMEGKTCITLHVTEDEVIDYSMFLDPRDNMYGLREIEESIRIQIADYMRANNLKLKKGTHTILRKGIVNGESEKYTYNEYIKMFKFEKIN